MTEQAKVKEIFERACELPGEERRKYLDDACGEQTPLRSEIESLLDAHSNAGTFMQSPTADYSVSDPTVAIGEKPGSVVDRYKLLEEIGTGGFGTVFMAQQFEPIRRRVALKIIKLGMDTKQVVARFEAERQALAMMDHPNIARVLDGGATEAGRPYFVMELVRGDPITDYCDREKLSMDERLRLFQQVCHAVQHAHQKGIIHRDIKPSNVLVTVADGRPVVKVIDFGIAKATNSELTEKTLFTEFRQLIGTPQYMSPEQAERSGVDVDTRSDIYSLGVLLYEILTGRTPVDGKRLKSAGWGELQKIIREEEAARPSVLVSTTTNDLVQLAKNRAVEPARLGVMLKGDLDWIVLKSIEKDRTRRYATASQLADDVQRYLDNEPVLATPPSTRYKLVKFFKRNKRWIAAAAIGVSALLIGLIGTSATTIWAMRERDNARTSELKAEREAAAALEEKKNAEKAEARAEQEAATARRMAALAGSPLITQEDAKQLGDQWKADIDRLRDELGPENPDVVKQECQFASWLVGRQQVEPFLEIAEELIPRARKVLGPSDANFLSLINFNTAVQVFRQELKPAELLELYEEVIHSSELIHGAQATNQLLLEYVVWLVKANRTDEIRTSVARYLRVRSEMKTPIEKVEAIRLGLAIDALGKWGVENADLYEKLKVLRKSSTATTENPFSMAKEGIDDDLRRLQGTWESEGNPETGEARIEYEIEGQIAFVRWFDAEDELIRSRQVEIRLHRAGPCKILRVYPSGKTTGDGIAFVYTFDDDQLVQVDGMLTTSENVTPIGIRRWTRKKTEEK